MGAAIRARGNSVARAGGDRPVGLRIAVRSLLEVALLAGQWVDTDVDDRPVAARALLLDVWPRARLRRGGTQREYRRSFHEPFHAEEPLVDSRVFSLVKRAPPAGFEPALPPPEGGALSPELRGLEAARGYQW